jgi:hypothetical protein
MEDYGETHALTIGALTKLAMALQQLPTCLAQALQLFHTVVQLASDQQALADLQTHRVDQAACLLDLGKQNPPLTVTLGRALGPTRSHAGCGQGNASDAASSSPRPRPRSRRPFGCAKRSAETCTP